MKSLLLSMMSLSICSCVGVSRPNTYAWGVNGAAGNIQGYNVKTDFDDNGIRNPGAQPKVRDLAHGLRDLNGAICFLPTKPTDPLGDAGIAGMKQWLQDSRDWAENHCQ